jgi:hypothetical protein
VSSLAFLHAVKNWSRLDAISMFSFVRSFARVRPSVLPSVGV